MLTDNGSETDSKASEPVAGAMREAVGGASMGGAVGGASVGGANGMTGNWKDSDESDDEDLQQKVGFS